ncbi:MAG: acetamidase/formamidase family protein, partial [Phycisphaeraceae bacterium]
GGAMNRQQASSILDIEQQGAYCYTYSDRHAPIARVQPGQRVRIHCVDCFENRLTDESMRLGDVARFPYTNPQTGPVYVEGATPGDTLAVHIEAIELTRDWAVTCLVPGFGLLTATAATRMLHAPLEQKVRKLPVRDGRVWFGDFSRPVAPFLGTLGTAPELEAINTLTPWSYGGNMDCPETCAGNTVHLPVNVEGALFFCGDGHAAQGDGEIGGVACEIPVNVTCRFEVIKDQAIRWPRITNDEYLMTVGCARPLEDATRIACAELVEWVAGEKHMDAEEALLWLSQVIELRVGNVVDPNYAVVAKVHRRYVEG